MMAAVVMYSKLTVASLLNTEELFDATTITTAVQ